MLQNHHILRDFTRCCLVFLFQQNARTRLCKYNVRVWLTKQHVQILKLLTLFDLFKFSYLDSQELKYLPMRRPFNLAKKGPWYLSNMDEAVMAEFLIAPVVIPNGLLHM